MKRLAYAAGVLLSIGGSFFLLQKSFLYAETGEVQPQEESGLSPDIAIEEPAVALQDEGSGQETTEAPSPVEAEAPEPAPTPEPDPAKEAVEEKKVVPEPKVASSPSEVLDLADWKQTLPTGSSKKPTEIKQPALAGFSDKTYFHVNRSSDGVVFRAPVNGVTTSGSGYPRSELREMTSEGKSLASWSTTSGTHSLFIDQAITAVPKKKKHVVAGQIHDADDDVIVIRLEYPKLFVDINGEEGPTLDPNYTLGKRFTVKFVAEGGKIKVYYNGSADPVHTLGKKGSGFYFKAGAYTQSNCSKESDCSADNYGEVVIHDLAVRH